MKKITYFREEVGDSLSNIEKGAIITYITSTAFRETTLAGTSVVR